MERGASLKAPRPAPRPAVARQQQEQQPRRRVLIARPCAAFTRRGFCPGERSGECKLLHDRGRVAVCRAWLAGRCARGEACLLSHEPTPQRMPDCVHFLCGACASEDCLFRHVNVGKGAAPCAAFRLGYCDKGNECPFAHALESQEQPRKSGNRTLVRSAAGSRKEAGSGAASSAEQVPAFALEQQVDF